MTPRPADLITRLQGHLGSTDLRGSIPVQPIIISIVLAMLSSEALAYFLYWVSKKMRRRRAILDKNDNITLLMIAFLLLLQIMEVVEYALKLVNRNN